MGRARVESGEKDAESSKGDAKRSDIEVKSARRFVVREILLRLLVLLFAAGESWVEYDYASGAGSKKTFRVIWWVISRSYCCLKCLQRTAHVPATDAQTAALMAIGRVPRVLLKMAPEMAPATTLLVGSCLPRRAPIVLFVPL